MFFLLRMAFWLGLVLVLLPRDQAADTDQRPQVNAAEAISAATAAVSDMSQFCTRQPAACEVGGQAASAIGHRAQDGARKLYRIITDRRAPDETGSIDNVPGAATGVGSRDTLTPDDLGIEWRLSAAAPG
ncbi:MAG: DUF5330 domain-containing protein [Xanthobacteraceae bacterium]|nr:DUF5330 domain-containing protein [Xanthobacteraceae bacterium]